MLCTRSTRLQLAVGTHQSSSTRRSHRGQRRSHRLPIVATSEFWYEEEQEFDALTEMLLPKQVVVCTPPACRQQLQQVRPVRFVAAFCSPAVKQEAEQLWEQLGRAGPPLFLKVRARDALATIEQQPQDGNGADPSSSAAETFWQEVTGLSWRLELDAGLNKEATLQAMNEQLLVVVESSKGLEQLVECAAGQSGDNSWASQGLCVLQFSGWNQGLEQLPLQSWRQLEPRLVAANNLSAAAADAAVL